MMKQFFRQKLKMTKQGDLRVLCGTASCPPYSSTSLVSPIDQGGVGETGQWWVLGWILIGRCPSKLCGDRRVWRYSDISFWRCLFNEHGLPKLNASSAFSLYLTSSL